MSFAWLPLLPLAAPAGAAEQNPGDLEVLPAIQAIRDYKDFVIGVKTAHFKGGWAAVDHAVQAADAAGVPAMVDFGDFKPELSAGPTCWRRASAGSSSTWATAEAASSVRGGKVAWDLNGLSRPNP
jgi:dihydroorotase